MLTDFHSHILPGMDDGASDTEESLKLLSMLSSSGAQRVVLTPHFYRHDEDINRFLSRREKSVEELSAALENMPNCPELALGAEVYFYPSLSSDPDFEKLCIEGTNYILLELPFEHFYDSFFSDFAKFMNRCSCKIILAHIERYMRFGNTQKEFERLLSMGDIICQMNCTSLVKSGFFDRRKLISMLNDGTVRLIGTDTHNSTTRPPMLGEAKDIIVKKCGQQILDRIIQTGNDILN
ncbi:MAG: CpsB/CapC family capsule biosynthesis tyrosine phosphatase [Oscillospiraceae bacterium]